ncbi:MAG: hypothetical protein EBU08_10430 [Micrococcales bacterium]|nr:hypothetical protein [Micrococcales bacterium]
MEEVKKQKVIEFFKSIMHLKDFDKLPLPKFVAKDLGIDIDTPKTISATDAVKSCLNKVYAESYTNTEIETIETPVDVEFPAIPAKHWLEAPEEVRPDEGTAQSNQNTVELLADDEQNQKQSLVVPFVVEGLDPLRGRPQHREEQDQPQPEPQMQTEA